MGLTKMPRKTMTIEKPVEVVSAPSAPKAVHKRGPQDCPGQGRSPKTKDSKSNLGVCPTCGKIVALKGDGMIRGHKPMSAGFGETVVKGQPPKEEMAPDAQDVPSNDPSDVDDAPSNASAVSRAHTTLLDTRIDAIAELVEWLEILTGLNINEVMEKRRSNTNSTVAGVRR